eukprot:15464758-Alexandrium_andersonii.AAC.2
MLVRHSPPRAFAANSSGYPRCNACLRQRCGSHWLPSVTFIAPAIPLLAQGARHRPRGIASGSLTVPAAGPGTGIWS